MDAVWWRCYGWILQHTATHCNTLRHTATHCNTLQHTATHCNTLQHTATHCNTLCCNTLQHTATHCNTLQHTATHCNTLNMTLNIVLDSIKCHIQCLAIHTQFTLKIHIERLTQWSRYALRHTQRAIHSIRDVGGWGRDPKKQKDFCTTVEKRQKQKSNERWT